MASVYDPQTGEHEDFGDDEIVENPEPEYPTDPDFPDDPDVSVNINKKQGKVVWDSTSHPTAKSTRVRFFLEVEVPSFTSRVPELQKYEVCYQTRHLVDAQWVYDNVTAGAIVRVKGFDHGWTQKVTKPDGSTEVVVRRQITVGEKDPFYIEVLRRGAERGTTGGPAKGEGGGGIRRTLSDREAASTEKVRQQLRKARNGGGPVEGAPKRFRTVG